MGKISSSGIWIDCKQLKKLTYRLTKQLSNCDRKLFGDVLIRYNDDIIANFSMAYTRGDERLVYDDGKTIYNVELKGRKLENIDATIAAFERYKAQWEFINDELCAVRTNDEKVAQTRRLILEALGKIEKGLNKWRNATFKQVVVSKTIRENA